MPVGSWWVALKGRYQLLRKLLKHLLLLFLRGFVAAVAGGALSALVAAAAAPNSASPVRLNLCKAHLGDRRVTVQMAGFHPLQTSEETGGPDFIPLAPNPTLHPNGCRQGMARSTCRRGRAHGRRPCTNSLQERARLGSVRN